MKKTKAHNLKSENGAAGKPEDFLVVGIGASAGGIQALKEFFENVPADSGVAYVVILHLSPDHESRLAEVLQTIAQIPVTQVRERVKVETNHVYVVPPNQHLGMLDGHIVVEPNLSVEERRAPVDIFFRTLAESRHAGAIAVILSGTGADGSMGLKRVKERGGVVFVQNPREAEFSEMPRNSIATELVDQVLNAAQIPAKIIAYKDNLRAVSIQDYPESRPENDQAALREIFAVLRVRTGHDFTNYKHPTVLRRIERRINVRELQTLSDYAVYMRDDVDEPAALLKDLLISVTNFFRDKEAFHFLETEVVPRILQDKSSQNEIRVWVAGCATGEEAYSLAMLFAEQIEQSPVAPKIQIFATDIDEPAIAAAREGFYTLVDVADVSPGRLRRFFTKEGSGYHVRRELREMILFAKHNLLKDAPFSHLDLVTCRNLLIYFNGAAQQRAMETFHFALNPGSFLFLGTSESVDGATDLYAPVDKEFRIYQSRHAAAKIAYPVPDAPPAMRYFEPKTLPASVTAGVATSQEQENRLLERISYADLHQQLLEQYAPPSIVVNENYDVVHLSERAGRFLHVAGGEPSKNLLHLIRPELRLELRTALFQAAQRRANVVAANLKVQTNGHAETINVQVRPVLREEDTARGFLLVLFEPSLENGDAAEAAEKIVASDEPIARRLEEELERTKSQLRTSVEQYEIQTEELRASNEELQAMNEELRSTAEELETSREELQSVNEELMTVNQELKIKIEELSVSNNDFKNLLNSTDIGTIFLDRALRVKMFTPAVRDVFGLIDADINRPLADITTKIDFDDLHRDVEGVLDNLQPIEREFVTEAGKWYLMRVFPYRTSDDKINGAVVTFVDITTRVRSEQALHQMMQSRERERRIFDTTLSTITDFAYIFDKEGRFIYSNYPLLNLLGITAEEIVGKNFFDLNYPDELAARHQREIEQVFETGEPIKAESTFTSPSGATGIYEYIFNPVLAADGSVESVAGSTRDITERKRSEAALRESEARIAADLAGMRRLYELQSKLERQNDINAALQDVLAAACEFTGTERGCVQLLSDDGERLEMAVWQGYTDDSPFISFFRYEGLELGCEVARVERQRLIIEDTAGFPSLEEGTDAGDAVRADKIRAAQSTPMTNRMGETIGVISTQFRQPHRPTDHELRLLDMLAWTAAEFLERHRADAALQKAHERLQMAMNAGRIYSWEMNPATRGLEWTDNMESVMGFPLPAQIDETFKLIHPDDIEEITALINGAIDTRGSYSADYRLIHPTTGEVLWFHAQAAFTDERASGEPRFVGIAQNITERKRAEEALRESEARLQKAIAIETVGVIFFNAEGKLTGCNYAFLEMSGYAHEQIESGEIGWEVLTPPEWMPRSEEAFAELKKKGRTTPYEKEYFRKNGSRFWGLFAASNINENESVEYIIDISTSKRAEEELRESEERLQLAATVSGFGIHDYDAARDFVYWSPELKAMHGLGADAEITFETVLDLIHPDDRERIKAEMKAALDPRGTGEFEQEFRIVRRGTGETRFLYNRSQTVFADEGANRKPVRNTGVVLDITVRREMEEAIRESEARLRAMFEQANVGIVQVTVDGQLLMPSQGFCKIIGYSADKAVGLHLRDITHPEDYERETELTRKLLAGETPSYSIEKRYIRKNGETLWGNMTATVVRSPAHDPLYVVEIVEDITERKQFEEDLRKSEERLRLLIESASDYAIFTMTLDNRIESWSRGAEKAFGWTESEALGQSGAIIFTPEDRAAGAPEQEIETALKCGRAPDERFHVRRDGSRFYVSGVMTSLKEVNGNTRGFVKISRDMTERLEAEKALRDREILQKLIGAQEDERKRIARDLHDELGQKLTALRFKLEAVRKICEEEEICGSIDEAQLIAKHIDEDVDFLAWELRPAALDDLGLSAALENYTQEWARHSGVSIQFQSHGMKRARLMPEVETNLYRIAQEALNNTHKHANATHVDVLLEKRGDSVILIIEDDGRGFKVSNKKNKSKGLGLIGMQERASLVGGTLEIESAPKQGTTIFVRVPASFVKKENE